MQDDKKNDMASLELDAIKQGPFLAAPGKTRKAMNWFFADKNRMYWILQASGWLGFFFLHVFSTSTVLAGRTPESLTYSATSALVGIIITTFMLRPIFRFARTKEPAFMLVTAGLGVILATIAMAAVKAQSILQIFPIGDEWMRNRGLVMGTDNYFMILVPDLPVNLFLLTSWTGFYFGLNYYLTLRGETERALQSARLADRAQLKMLRYQLNPHFLFNTLNAISTLVLEKDGKNANNMLTKLSAFLRYSLESDPLQKTSLAEELHALDLYLNIERTRFGPRLTFKKNIDDEALAALVPSLILQPAIENAIKYAIAKMEHGGEICISAKRTGDMLLLEVTDNGPDAPQNPEVLLSSDNSTGVGLINMRDRLAHLYGTNFKFTARSIKPTGLCVTMLLPFELRA